MVLRHLNTTKEKGKRVEMGEKFSYEEENRGRGAHNLRKTLVSKNNSR